MRPHGLLLLAMFAVGCGAVSGCATREERILLTVEGCERLALEMGLDYKIETQEPPTVEIKTPR